MAPVATSTPVPTLAAAARRVVALSEDPRKAAMPADADAAWRAEWEQAFDDLSAAAEAFDAQAERAAIGSAISCGDDERVALTAFSIDGRYRREAEPTRSPFDKLELLLARHIHSPEDWAAYRLRIFTALCELSEEERERDPVAANSDQLIDFGAALLWLSQPHAVQKKASELDMRFAATARLIFEGAVEEMRQMRRQQPHSAQQSQPLTPRAEPADDPQSH